MQGSLMPIPVLTLAAGAGAVAFGAAAAKARARLDLSRAKFASLAGHAKLSRRIAALIPYYAYDEDRFFQCDGAPACVAAQRRAGLARLDGADQGCGFRPAIHQRLSRAVPI
jgi:glutamate-1-semialdehyde 2,1-aminomutase